MRFAINGDACANGGVACDYVYGGFTYTPTGSATFTLSAVEVLTTGLDTPGTVTFTYQVADGIPSTGIFEGGPKLSGPGSYAIGLGDLDGDGDLGAFVTNTWPAGSKVWFNDGNGNSTESGQVLGSQPTWGLDLGDLEGDTGPDAWAANTNSGRYANRVWRNQGGFGFSPFATVTISLTQQSPPPALTGRVTLQGRSDHAGATVTAWGGGVPISTTTTGASGAYTLTLPSGLYTITVEITRSLDAQRTGVLVSGAVTLPNVTLLAGDANDDLIDILDLALIGAHHGLLCGDPAWDPHADINADCLVDLLNLTLASGNFQATSPVPWP